MFALNLTFLPHSRSLKSCLFGNTPISLSPGNSPLEVSPRLEVVIWAKPRNSKNRLQTNIWAHVSQVGLLLACDSVVSDLHVIDIEWVKHNCWSCTNIVHTASKRLCCSSHNRHRFDCASSRATPWLHIYKSHTFRLSYFVRGLGGVTQGSHKRTIPGDSPAFGLMLEFILLVIVVCNSLCVHICIYNRYLKPWKKVQLHVARTLSAP